MKDYDSNFVSAEYDRIAERKRVRKRRSGTRRYKNHLKDISGITFFSGAYFMKAFKDPTRPERYVRYYRNQRSSKIKSMCNRAVRRYPGILKRGDYRKVSEFWWEYD